MQVCGGQTLLKNVLLEDRCLMKKTYLQTNVHKKGKFYNTIFSLNLCFNLLITYLLVCYGNETPVIYKDVL